MEQYEIPLLIKNLYLKNKESWEQARMVSYIIAQTQSTKKLKVTDIIKFPWENSNKQNQIVSSEDKERLIKKTKLIKQYLNGNSK